MTRSGLSTPPDWLVESVDIIRDFPEPGIVFRDLSPLWRSSAATSRCAIALCDGLSGIGDGEASIDAVVGIEARGFLAGLIVAQRLGVGFIGARKPGKLPGRVAAVDYDLEYGSDRLEIQHSALRPGERVVIVDDVIATGGTAAAAIELVESTGASVAGFRSIIELDGLGGRDRIVRSGMSDEAVRALWMVS